MARKVLKENCKLSNKINSIEEFMEKNNLTLRFVLVKNIKYEVRMILSDGKRFFKFLDNNKNFINEFPPRQFGNFYLCDQFGEDLNEIINKH